MVGAAVAAMVGAAGGPAPPRVLVAAGHEFGNHTYTHRRMVLVAPATVWREVEATDAAIRARPVAPLAPPDASR